MLKVLIADDEPGHRLGLMKHVHWKGVGYDPPLLAEDAEEALYLTQNQRIDVLIADVCMPGMDGIELVKEMRTRYPELLVLIISGYDEFEFARSAVEAGARAYLLKPLKIEEVEQWLQKFRDEILLSRQLAEADLKLKKKLNGSLRIARERFLEELLEDAWEGGRLAQKAELLDLPSEGFHFRLAVLSVDVGGALAEKEPEMGSTLIYRMMNMMETAFADYSTVIVKLGLKRVAALLLKKSEEAREDGGWQEDAEGQEDTEELGTRFELIKKSVGEERGASATICVSGRETDWKEVYRLYNECVHYLGAGLAEERGQVIWLENIRRYEPEPDFSIPQISLKVSESVGEADREKVIGMVSEAFRQFLLGKRVTLDFVQAFSLGVLSELSRKSELTGFQMARPYTDCCRAILGCISVEEVRDMTLEILAAYYKAFEEYRTQRKSRVIEQAARYIAGHLEEDTTVKELSEIVHMNSSYLSVLFKKEMGETITEYVNRLRIEKAKDLLLQGLKVLDIAQRVGYQNPSYFANQFKKAVGCTPAEYRKYTSPDS